MIVALDNLVGRISDLVAWEPGGLVAWLLLADWFLSTPG